MSNAIATQDRNEWYNNLPAAVRDEARLAADDIRSRMKRTAKEIVEIGRQLNKIKARLPHGRWGEWLDIEFQMSDRMARNFMNVADRFGGVKTEKFSDLSPSVLYALAAPSTPDTVINAALDQAADGHQVNGQAVQDLRRADAELREESPVLHTHGPGDVADRAADNRWREDETARWADGEQPAEEPKELRCPMCDVGEEYVKRLRLFRDSTKVICENCNHEWETGNRRARGLPVHRKSRHTRPPSREPAQAAPEPKKPLDLPPPPPAQPTQPQVIITVRVQPGDVLAQRRCIIAAGEEGQMPKMESCHYDQLMATLTELLDEYVGSADLVGEFLEVER